MTLLCVFLIEQSVKSSTLNKEDEEVETWNRQLAKPDDQLELTELELAEEIPKCLTTENTNVLRNLVTYSFLQGMYIPVRHINTQYSIKY